MNGHSEKVVIAQMRSREKQDWAPVKKTKAISKRLLRNTGIFAAVSLCIGTGVYFTLQPSEQAQSVMSHLTAGFEYDESLGRLQFVSNILPESAMVFLSNDDESMLTVPTSSSQIHTWSSTEPWVEFACKGTVSACDRGEVMTVVKNRQDEYTVRMMHQNGYESIYSGLNTVCIQEADQLDAGQSIGTASGFAAFELRKDGLSVMPVFSAQ